MRLKSFQVFEFRSVIDSGEITLDDVTCLVGKNEAGKTALLQALCCLNPLDPERGTFDPVEDYPRKFDGEYRNDLEAGNREPAVVVRGVFELNDEEVKAIEDVFGAKVLKQPSLTLDKNYKNKRTHSLQIDEAVARENVVKAAKLPADALKALKGSNSWEDLNAKIAEVESSEELEKLKQFLVTMEGDGASGFVWNKVLSERLPQFLYFDDYYQLNGQDNLNALIARKNQGSLRPSDHPLIGLVNLARLKLEDILIADRTEQVVTQLESAGNHLTVQALKYWSQNKHLQLKFDIREAKSNDPEGMREGQNIWAKVYDSVHWATTRLGVRSKGFIWFFSFLAWYEDVKRQKKNVILLLDEPGLSLHGKAQADFLRYIEEQLRPHHQVVFSTHSPFMVDPQHFERVRIVQDASIDANEALPKEEDGTKVLTDVFDASDDSLFPLQGALGYEIHQTLFVGPNCLIVEGPADMLFIQGMSSVLEREGREGLSEAWTVTPVGGGGKVPAFVAMLAPQKGLNIAVLLDVQNSDRQQIEDLYKKNLLNKKKVHTYADFSGNKEADVEDMFERDFYVELVNGEYKVQLKAKIMVGKLNAHIPRVVKAVDEYLTANPMKQGSFGHFRPARYFVENLDALTPNISDGTKDRFEAAFKALNKLLP